MFEIITVGLKDLNIFLGIATSAADAAAVNSNGIEMLFTNDLGRFVNKASPFLVMFRKACLKDLLTVLFYATEFVIISH